jgi:hypothetical protein
MSGELRLDPDRLGKVPRTGAVQSVQAGELEIRGPASRVLSRSFLRWAATAYWRLITRFTLGLIRVTFDGEDQCVVLVARPLVLLRFRSPEYQLEPDRGSVTWRIRRGILVSRSGRDRGFLRLSIAEAAQPPANGQSRLRVEMQVHNFYPWLRGSGAFATVGVWIYAQTQQRIHRAVTRRFMRRLTQTAAG